MSDDIIPDHTFSVTRRRRFTGGMGLQWWARCSCGWESQAFTDINITFDQMKGHLGILGDERYRQLEAIHEREADKLELARLRKIVADNELTERFAPLPDGCRVCGNPSAACEVPGACL